MNALRPEATGCTQGGADDSLDIDNGAFPIAVQVGGTATYISQRLVCRELYVKHVNCAIVVEIAAEGCSDGRP